jgi:hypothetical protein
MAITSAVCSTFKQELLKGTHDFDGGATYKIALFTSSASMGASTTAYADSNQVADGNGYSTGGATLSSPAVALSSTTAYIDFADATWSSASFTANGALIYRSDGSAPTNDAVCVIAFGGDYTATNGTFTVQFPAAAASTAILRLS